MAVYVDQSRWKLGRMKMCHMIADNTSDLLKMANELGLKTKWIERQGTNKEHFNICLSNRKKAIEKGAIEITTKQIIEIIQSREKQNGSKNHTEIRK